MGNQWDNVTAASRFEAGVMPVPEAGCWLWVGAMTGAGKRRYGRIGVNGQKVAAHRYSWEQANGPIPEGMCVCHKCDTTLCVNPDHLFLGTIAENCHDRDRKGRQVTARGSAHKLAKITEKDAAEIRALRGKVRQIDLASRFGISQCGISRIQLGESWAHG